MCEVRRLRPDDWQAYRTIRRTAVLDSYGADSVQYQREAGLGEQDWRRRLDRHAQFGAYPGGMLVGVAGGKPRTGLVHLYSMWITPAARGRGLGGLLVSAVVAWARTEDACTVSLHVEPRNETAVNLYRRSGFVAVPGEHTHRSGEVRMEFDLGTDDHLAGL